MSGLCRKLCMGALALLGGLGLMTQVTRPVYAAEDGAAQRTFCNPLNLDYGFNGPNERHAADPVIVPFKGKYYLFTTEDLPGFRVSDDLLHWRDILWDRALWPLVANSKGRYCAPAAATDGTFLYYINMCLIKSARTVAVMRTRDPLGGKWEDCGRIRKVTDPCLFIDNGHYYIYYGLGKPTRVFELDPKTMTEIPGSDRPLRPDVTSLDDLKGGYERGRRELADEIDTAAWLGRFAMKPCQEGAWMTKHDGRYYLQYATPGTVTQWYCDAVLESSSPTGPFTPCDYSPASMKAGGFIGSAGHSCVFQDFHGNWWRVTTMWIGVSHLFERRIGLFPVHFDGQGRMWTETALGDLPQVMPRAARDTKEPMQAGWWVLSHGKATSASSTLEGHEARLAADENVRTWWSARSGNPGEWFMMDLGKSYPVRAVQVNFAEQDCAAPDRIREDAYQEDYHQYALLASGDGKTWRTLADRRESRAAAPHDYIELAGETPVRFLKVVNQHAAAEGKFALRDLRVFGNGGGQPPAPVTGLSARRHADDDRNVSLSWQPARGAQGYLVRYGVAPEALYQCVQAPRGETAALTLHTLNRGVGYYFRVDAFNDSGVTTGPVARGE